MDDLERYCGQLMFTLFALYMEVPGSSVCCRRIFLALSVLLLSFSTIFQGLLFVTQGFTLKIIVEILPTIVATFGCLLFILYITFATRAQFQYQRILSLMRKDLCEKRSAEENEIKRQFAMNAKRFTKIYFCSSLIALIGIFLTGFSSTFLDLIIPLNQSRERELLFNGAIFIDQKKYFYHIYFVECCTALVVGILVIVGENISVIIGQYVSGMSAILGYQLRNITEIKGQKILDNIDYELLLTRRIQTCVKSHQKVLDLAVNIAEFYDIPLTLVLTGSFCSLTMSLVQVTDPQLINTKMTIYTIGQVSQLFLVSCLGQRGIDNSLQTSQDAYSAKWDDCPPRIRKMLQLVMLRSSKPCRVFARGIYVLSIENFMSVLQTITSFFMVFRRAG